MQTKSIGKYISIISRQSQAYISYEMKKFGITGSEYLFLIHTPNEGVITQQEICDDFKLDPAFATRGVKSLVEKGYLSREKSQVDKRSYDIALTDKGRTLKPLIQERLDNWSYTLAGDMTDEELYDFIDKLIEISKRASK